MLNVGMENIGVGRLRKLDSYPDKLNVVVEKNVPAKSVSDVLGLDVNCGKTNIPRWTKILVKGFIRALVF